MNRNSKATKVLAFFKIQTLLLCLIPTLLFSSLIKPAMLFDTDIIFDNAWNETIYKGIKKFEKNTGISVEIRNKVENKDFIDTLQSLAANNYNPIMLSYTEYRKDAISQVMHNFPKTRFIVINGALNMPNAHYISFSNQESSFLAGYLAAKKSKSKKIGFIGATKIPVINNFLCGYIKGARYANEDVSVHYEYIGSDFHAFTNPKKAYKIAQEQIKKGADVLFAPAGPSSTGVLKAAHDKKVYGIGVDSNQNGLFPGSVLTSAMTRADNAVFRALMAAKNGIWGSQMKVMGLQERGVELAFDEHNKKLISKELKAEIDELTADIILDKITLNHYMLHEECVYQGEKLF